MAHSAPARWLFLALLVPIALALLVACGEEEKASPTAAPTKPAAPAAAPSPGASPAATTAASGPAAAPAAADIDDSNRAVFKLVDQYRIDKLKDLPGKPQKGGVHRVSAWLPATDFDPVVNQWGGGIVPSLVYDQLFGYPEKRGLPLEQMMSQNMKYMYGKTVESWDVSKDGTVWTLKIRKGIKFHNLPPVNGRALDAEDVKANIELRQKIAPAQWADIASVETPDTSTVVIKLKEYNAAFWATITATNMWLAPREIIRSEDRQLRSKQPIGTGPFVMKEATPKVKTVVVRNPDYWRKDEDGVQLPYLDQWEDVVLGDPAAQIAALRTGQIDTSGYFVQTVEQFNNVLKTNPDLQVQVLPGCVGCSWHIIMKLEQKPFDDVRVRRALSMAIDRVNWVNGPYGGAAHMHPLLPMDQLGIYLPKPLSWFGPYNQFNPTEAKKLLTEAGYPNGFKVKINLSASQSQPGAWLDSATFIKDNWKRYLNVDLEVNNQDAQVYNTEGTNRTWEGLRTAYISPAAREPGNFCESALYTKSPLNLIGPRAGQDPELDGLCEAQKKEMDPAKRQDIFMKIEKRVEDQQWFIIPGVWIRFNMMQPWVGGLTDFYYGVGWTTLSPEKMIRVWVDCKNSKVPSDRCKTS